MDASGRAILDDDQCRSPSFIRLVPKHLVTEMGSACECERPGTGKISPLTCYVSCMHNIRSEPLTRRHIQGCRQRLFAGYVVYFFYCVGWS